MLKHNQVDIYTDGSCNPVHGTGGWAVILLIEGEKITLKGSSKNTTHQRMELMAVIKAFEYLNEKNLVSYAINVYADSQYVVDLCQRKEKLKASSFLTKKKVGIRNVDLVRQFFDHVEKLNVTFTKIKAHQRKTEHAVGNREADKLSRKIVRNSVGEGPSVM